MTGAGKGYAALSRGPGALLPDTTALEGALPRLQKENMLGAIYHREISQGGQAPVTRLPLMLQTFIM